MIVPINDGFAAEFSGADLTRPVSDETIAAIEASPTTRLSELWLERKFGPATFRIGQLAADAEFFASAGDTPALLDILHRLDA